jgi:hypothetical protein
MIKGETAKATTLLLVAGSQQESARYAGFTPDS